MADTEDKRSEGNGRHSGQVRHDDRGNAVWHWAADTARTAMASTSQLLRKLDLTGLSLESDQPHKADEPKVRSSKPLAATPGAVAKKRTVDSRTGGFDPYSTNAGSAKRAAPRAASATRQAAASAPRRYSWWRRLLRLD